jgi:hypothetical protein
MEGSTTRGTTALVYCLINSSLYTGTVQRWWRTPNWLDGQLGCRQVSTGGRLGELNLFNGLKTQMKQRRESAKSGKYNEHIRKLFCG